MGDNEVREIPFGALRGYPKLEVLLMPRNQVLIHSSIVAKYKK